MKSMDSIISKIKVFNSLLLLLSLLSCSFVKDIINKEAVKPETKVTYLPNSCVVSSNAMLSNSETLINSFSLFLKKISQKKIKTTFEERAALWLMVQAYASPQLASPSARISFVKIDKQEITYLDISTEETAYPLFLGLEKLLETGQSKMTLAQLDELLSKNFERNVQVERELQQFIENNKKVLRTNDQLKPIFFRGKQTVKQGESIKSFSFAKAVAAYQSAKRSQLLTYKIDDQLLPFTSDRLNGDIRCNFDLNLYRHSIYLNTSSDVHALPVIYVEGKKQLIASLSQDTTNYSVFGIGHLIRGSSSLGMRPAFCVLSNRNFTIALLSNHDRDPAQALFKMIEKSPLRFDNKGITAAMIQGRELILLNPFRAVIESDQLSDERLDALMKQKIPLYHVSPLGNVHATFTSEKQETTIYSDSRRQNALFCTSAADTLTHKENDK